LCLSVTSRKLLSTQTTTERFYQNHIYWRLDFEPVKYGSGVQFVSSISLSEFNKVSVNLCGIHHKLMYKILSQNLDWNSMFDLNIFLLQDNSFSYLQLDFNHPIESHF